MATRLQEELDLSRLVERPEDHTDDAGFLVAAKSLLAKTAVIRFPANQSFTMVPHAVKYANAVMAATGADSFGTYAGHSPTPERALDCFTQVPSDRRAPETPGLGRVLGDDIAEFAVENIDRFGIDYVIFRQHIYNPEIATYWRQMEDRGGVTNNHFDHVHVSFDLTASGGDTPAPVVDTEDVMSLSVRYVWGPNALNQTDWVFDGPSRVFAQIGAVGVLNACDKSGVIELGHVDDDTHGWFKGVAGGWK